MTASSWSLAVHVFGETAEGCRPAKFIETSRSSKGALGIVDDAAGIAASSFFPPVDRVSFTSIGDIMLLRTKKQTTSNTEVTAMQRQRRRPTRRRFVLRSRLFFGALLLVVALFLVTRPLSNVPRVTPPVVGWCMGLSVVLDRQGITAILASLTRLLFCFVWRLIDFFVSKMPHATCHLL